MKESTLRRAEKVVAKTVPTLSTIRILGFSNGSSWLIDPFQLMDMSILIKGPKHFFLINQFDYNDLFE